MFRQGAPRLIDGALVAGCLLASGLAVKTPWSPLPWPIVLAAGLVGSAALWPRRRWPLCSAVAGAGAFALTGNPVPLLGGLYAAGRYAPRRRGWLGGIAAWAGYATWSWLDAGRLTLDEAIFPPLGVGLVLLIGVHQATREALVVSLREQTRLIDTERLLRDEQARAAERAHIAREMHDVMAHKVSLIALYAGALELRADDDPKLRDSASLIQTTAREALTDLRDVLGILHDGLEPPGPEATLTTLVAASARAGQPIELSDDAGELPAATARVVYRIVQEGLTNARKHAPQAPTTVSVCRADDGSVAVSVCNELTATAGPTGKLPGAGSGLAGLAERIRLAGGSLRSGPVHGGWRLSAVVPGQHPHADVS
ncbi:sensor histidine kinase [Actinoplanes sp. NPDC051859]|uniref:sensor histidine kinase n=1 Tax=Actinoplanes sp. NPDC051859 TaxID=3363909 RepID=UPI00379D1714